MPMYYIELTHQMDSVDETFRCVCIRCSTEDEVEHRLGRGDGIFWREEA